MGASAADLLNHLCDCGLTALIDGGNLIVRPKAALTDETRALIRAHRAELIAVLAQQSSWGWHIHPMIGPAFEIYEVPEPTHADVQRAYPEAQIEPMPEKALHRRTSKQPD